MIKNQSICGTLQFSISTKKKKKKKRKEKKKRMQFFIRPTLFKHHRASNFECNDFSKIVLQFCTGVGHYNVTN